MIAVPCLSPAILRVAGGFYCPYVPLQVVNAFTQGESPPILPEPTKAPTLPHTLYEVRPHVTKWCIAHLGAAPMLLDAAVPDGETPHLWFRSAAAAVYFCLRWALPMVTANEASISS